MSLIAQMIARNEADRFLPEVLEHLHNIVDLVIFTDDKSTDNTVEIARKYGCQVFETPWDKPHFGIHEGELRQCAWENLTKFALPGDWILAIDADEKLYGSEKIPALISQPHYEVLGITFYHMWNRTQYRADKAWIPNVSSRLFRYQPNGSFTNRRLACGSEPTYVQDAIRRRRVLWDSGLKMMHLGYVHDEDKVMKYERYMTLDGGDFHARAHIESIIDPNPILLNWS